MESLSYWKQKLKDELGRRKPRLGRAQVMESSSLRETKLEEPKLGEPKLGGAKVLESPS